MTPDPPGLIPAREQENGKVQAIVLHTGEVFPATRAGAKAMHEHFIRKRRERLREFLWRCEGVAGGVPCFRGRGVMVEFVVGRFAAGERLSDIAADYEVSAETVEEAIRLVILARGTNLDAKGPARRVNEELGEPES